MNSMLPSPENATLERLEELAAQLWSELPHGAVVWLSGDIGGGKTTFARALVGAASGEGARSPTFALVNYYESPAGLLIHVDCYRLQNPSEAVELDFPDLQREARLLMIEWPENAGAYVPRPDAHFRFGHIERRDERFVERLL